jgi:hypothetical protein
MKIRLVLILFLSVSLAALLSGFTSYDYTIKGHAIIVDTNYETENASEPMDLETFQDSLSDYGDFVSIDNSEVDPENTVSGENDATDVDIYFNYIWVPNQRYRYEGWTPYNDGRWVWTDWGWTWVSDYSWGWGPYHYGRWWYSESYGWVWSPGRRWGPGWVNWRNNEGYVGWYPISPRNHWRNNRFDEVNHHYRDDGWVVTRKLDFTNHITKSTVISGNTRNEVLKTSTPFLNIQKNGNKLFNSGPDVKDIEKVQNKKIVQKPITEVSDLHLQKKVINNTKVEDKINVVPIGAPPNNNKTTQPKSKTNVNGVTNYNTSKTYNSTETYNKTNTGSKVNTNKNVNTNTNGNTNNNVNTNNTQSTNKPGKTYNPVSSNKTGTANKTGKTSPKVIQTPKVVTTPPVKNSSPPAKNNQTPKKESSPPVKDSK